MKLCIFQKYLQYINKFKIIKKTEQFLQNATEKSE